MKTWEITLCFHLTDTTEMFNPEGWSQEALLEVASALTTTTSWTFTELVPKQDEQASDQEDQ